MPINGGSAVLTVSELADAFKARGLVLTATASGLSVRPKSGVTEAIATAITYHKSALLQVLNGGAPVTPSACAFCTVEFVSSAGQNCRHCVRLLGLPFRFAPGSAAETQFLHRWENRNGLQSNRPNCPTSGSRPPVEQLEQLIDVSGKSYMRAHIESFRKTGVNCPNCPTVPAASAQLLLAEGS